MKKLMKVFRSDLISIVKNPIALIIVMGICAIPALYAWVNIKACWDPYGTTSNIPIAVVNNDKGITIAGKEVNVGADVVKKLKDNKKVGWKFVSEQEADMGVRDGTYFATIEIPESFSKDLSSITANNSKKAEIIYKVDTKANPVASKITGVAEGTLIDEITSNFVQTVNKEALEKVKSYKEDMNKNRDDIIKLKNALIRAGRDMDTIISVLENVNANSKNLNVYLTEVKNTIPALTSGMTVQEGTIKSTENLIQNTNNNLNSTFKSFKQSLEEIKVSIDKIVTILDTIQVSNNSSQISSSLNAVSNNINSANNNINSNLEYLETMNKTKETPEVSQTIVNLKNLQDKLNEQNKVVTEKANETDKGNIPSQAVINQLKENLKKISNNSTNLISAVEKNTMPVLNDISKNLVNATKDAAKLLKTSQIAVDGINTLISSSADGSKLAADVSGEILEQLNQYKDEIKYIGDQLSKVDDNDLDTIIAILKSNPDLIGEFIANPFTIKEVKVYEVPNYGSSMAPIYSVLALWVGGLILTSVLKTESVKFKKDETLTIRHKYFGKMLTFIFLAIIQGVIIALGNIFLLKIYCVNPFLMVVFAILSSITFATIIFTNVSLLGNLGKAINIILMIVQLAGCGGSYPIQVDPLIFRILQPIFPFSYAVGGFREAIAGPLVSSVVLDIVMLTAFFILYIIIGFTFKPRLHSIVKRFEKKFNQSGIGE
ncbi:putative membrane protein [Clostridium cavendishii DSM 21758]|uniref:Putative membrane protein n=1 Tax=Clostridium cavendishii DSM 21758 TaxID=1121302 RepID=A0A1M6CTC6_9CLOT|nr:YhgE/Pip domain-containing protein [Clostridium cavendishii]SHI64335.1 putative membrane protein [Clostridium cavendishii DSM 21758]